MSAIAKKPLKKAAENYSPTGTPPVLHVLKAQVPQSMAGERCDHVLALLFPDYSRTRLAAWLKDGLATIDGVSRAPKDKLWGGEAIAVSPQPDPQASAFRAQDIAFPIVFEDGHIIVINKPPGLVVHPGSGNWDGTLLNALLAHAPALVHLPRAGIVHRIDKDTSGLLVVAKTLTAQTALVRALQAHDVIREYIAVVHGVVEGEGTVDAPIGRHKVQRTRMAVTPGGKAAVTHYEPIENFNRVTVLRCRLETGRTHQIRVHLASIGHPIVGDPVYGGQRAAQPFVPPFARQALHAERLGLIHPASGKPRTWKAPVPADMRKLLMILRRES